MADIFDTVGGDIFDQVAVAPTPQELSTLEAPEGSPQREDINRGVAGNLFAPPGVFARDPTLAELIDAAMPSGVKEAMRNERRIPLAPPLPEQGQFEQGGLLPYVAGAAQAVEGMVPTSWEQAREMIKPPMGGVDIEKENELGAAWRGERGPVEQAAAITGTALQAAPLLHLPFAESPLRPTPRDTALVQKLMEARDRELTPPPIPPEYAERRFQMQPTPPEAPPDISPSVPIEQTLPNIKEPLPFNPEAGPAPRPESPMPLRTETANLKAERVLANRQELLNRQKDLKQRFINGEDVGSELEAVEAEIMGPGNPVVHPPPKAQEGPVQAPGGPTVASEAPGGVTGAGSAFVKATEGKPPLAPVPTDMINAVKLPSGKIVGHNVEHGDVLSRYSEQYDPHEMTSGWVLKRPTRAETDATFIGTDDVQRHAGDFDAAFREKQPSAVEIPAEDARFTREGGEQQPSGAGLPQKPSKIGQSIEAKAVEAKLTKGFGETAGYDPITIKDQAARASGVVQESPAHARAIVRGEAPLPDGLRGTSLITAMEEHLLRNPDAQVAYELANSPLTSATSAAAQEMRLMSERVPDSLSAKFAEIKAAREAGAKLRGETPAKVKADINGEVVKAASKRPTWEQFVKEIVC